MAQKAVKKAVKKAVAKTKTAAAKPSNTIKKTTQKTKVTAKAVKGDASVNPAATRVGQKVPSFAILSTGGGTVNLAALKNRKVVLYFYPKDSTPGCTLEGYDFKRLEREFAAAGAVIFGVSKDSLRSHETFKKKCGFPFELLVDDEEKLCRAFDVIQMKSLYGREYLGIERSTFVIDERGVVAQEWRKVKVNGHAEEVLQAVRKI